MDCDPLCEVVDAESGDFKWTLTPTKVLLNLYLAHKQDFRDPRKKNKLVWASIIKSMEDYGYRNLCMEKVDRKFRNLKKTFLVVRKKSPPPQIPAWEHFAIMEEIFSDHPSFTDTAETSGMLKEEDEDESYFDDSTLFADVDNAYDEEERDTSGSSISRHSEVVAPTPLPRSIKKLKADKARRRYSINKKLLEEKEQRRQQMDAMIEAILESNRLQAERNNLFKEYLNHMKIQGQKMKK